jgi:hypothetical protein
MRKKYGPFPGSFSRRPFSQQVYPVEVRSTLAFHEEKLHRTAASQAQVLRKPIEQGKHT